MDGSHLGLTVTLKIDSDQYTALNTKLDQILSHQSTDAELTGLIRKAVRIAERATQLAENLQKLTR